MIGTGTSKAKKQFFFEKKNQKTFDLLDTPDATGA
jgi:hypothetical protein